MSTTCITKIGHSLTLETVYPGCIEKLHVLTFCKTRLAYSNVWWDTPFWLSEKAFVFLFFNKKIKIPYLQGMLSHVDSCVSFFFFRGLLGGHFAALALKNTGKGMSWYNNELVAMAKEIGYRLLPAFNTTTGIPYPRVSFSLLFYAF